MRRIRIILSYDGTDFHGWQMQPGLPTIQGVLEEVLAAIEGCPVTVHGSGRTDAGVHALAQVAALSLQNPIPVENLRRAMNRLLPRSIRILEAEEVAAEFHPRFEARAKTYQYRLWREEICPPFDRFYVCHHPYPLNEEAMITAARLFEGEHDFTAFASADESDDSSRSKVRTVYSSSVWRDGPRLLYQVRGSGFLKHMVRNVVGVMLEVGKGNMTAGDICARLEPSCGIAPGPSAPARGLFLINVEY
jgi:tRNA pseudouridine38-40 synthase